MNDDRPHMDIDLLTRFFSAECSPEESDYVLQWKEAHPDNLSEFNSLQQAWDTMDITDPRRAIDINAEWDHHQKHYLNYTINKSRNLWQLTIRLAASILILIGLSYVGWNYFSHKTISTDMASTREVKLPDGSMVSLNAGSQLNYSSGFGKDKRQVSLKGEAYFEVTHQPDKPFIITVNGIEVKVLGTKFNIKASGENQNVEVTVAEGRVTVYRPGQEMHQVIVTKGQQALYQVNSQQILKQENPDRNYISWKTHTLIFENDSLANIIKTLQSVYHQEFILENTSLTNCTLTTTFENKDLGEVLKIMKKTLDISFEEKDGKIVIRGKGC